MAEKMPEVNAQFGAMPVITFPENLPPVGLKSVEIIEGDGPMVRRGDTITVNYHGVVWGRSLPLIPVSSVMSHRLSALALDRSSRVGIKAFPDIISVRV